MLAAEYKARTGNGFRQTAGKKMGKFLLDMDDVQRNEDGEWTIRNNAS